MSAITFVPGGPTYAMTVPYLRTSPVHIPRRDLVLGGVDSLLLRITVVESDNPDALPIELTTGLGTPTAQLTIWADMPDQYFWDYGYPLPVCGQVLWSGAGVQAPVLGAFDFAFPSGTIATFPRRCGWSVQLSYGTHGAEVLMAGKLHIRRVMGNAYTFASGGLMTDDYIFVHTDSDAQVLT